MSKKDTRTGDRHVQAGRLVRAPRELWEAVDAAAKARGLNRSEAIRIALWEWVEAEESRELRRAPAMTAREPGLPL